MRRMVLAAVLALAMLAMLVPPALAQTPKVTITGLFDQVMSVGKNYSEGNFSRDSDSEWYARTRFRPDFTFEVGRVKAVMGLELDLTYGQVGSCGGGPSKNQTDRDPRLLARPPGHHVGRHSQHGHGGHHRDQVDVHGVPADR